MDWSAPAQRLDLLVKGSESWWEAGTRIRAAKGDSEEASACECLVEALSFQLEVRDITEGKRSGSLQPEEAVGRLSEGLLVVLDETALLAQQPILLSRLHDLLWIRRRGSRPHAHAAGAIDAYLQLARGAWRPIHRADCLLRALELALELRDGQKAAELCDLMLLSARDALQTDERLPGVVLRLLRPVLQLRDGVAQHLSEKITQVLEDATEQYRDDPWLYESVIDLRRPLVDGDERLLLLRSVVERWEEAAGQQDTLMLRLVWLRKAEGYAVRFGLHDDARRVRTTMQEIPHDQLEWMTFSEETALDRDEVGRYVGRFVETDNWRDSLRLFAAMPPLSGDADSNLRQVDDNR